MPLTAQTVRAATRNRPWIGRFVRIGYLSKGLIYSFIGILALRVAVGLRGRLTDPDGVLRDVLRRPFGEVMLAIIAAGIITYALYYIVEGIADLKHRGGGLKGWLDRSLTIIKAIAYGSIGVQAVLILLRNRAASGDTEDTAQTVMQFPLGSTLLALIGAGIAVYAFTQLRMVWRGGFDDEIDVARVRRDAPWILPLGRFGIGARSIILALMGGTLMWAGLRERPSDADGYSEALRFVASLHPMLLAAVGIGLLCFGLYQACHAKYAKLA
jgi:hypothetical protein